MQGGFDGVNIFDSDNKDSENTISVEKRTILNDLVDENNQPANNTELANFNTLISLYNLIYEKRIYY